MSLIHVFYKTVTFWKSLYSPAPFGDYHPTAKILPMDLPSSLGADLSNITLKEGHRSAAERKPIPGGLNLPFCFPYQ